MDMRAHPPAHHPLRRAARIAGKIARVIALSLLGLVLLVLLLATVGLELEPVRERVRRELVPLVSEALGAPLEIDEIERLSPFRVRVRGVRLLGPDGLPVAAVGKLTAYIDPFALIAMRVHIPNAVIDRMFVDLGDLDQEEGARGGLLDVLAAMPKSDEPEAKDESGGIVLAFHDLEITRGHAKAIANATRFDLRSLNGELDVDVGDALAIAVEALTASMEREGFAAAYLQSLRAAYRDNEPIDADLVIVAGATRLDLKAQVGPAAESGAWPIDGRVLVRALEPTTLYAFGLEPDPLRAPIDLDVQTSGSTHDLTYAVVLSTPGGVARLEGTAHALAPEGDLRRSADALLVTEDFDLRRFLAIDVEPITLELRADVESSDAFESVEAKVELARARYAKDALPHVAGHARYVQDGALHIEQLVASYPSGTQLVANATLSDGGAIRARAKLQTHELRDIAPLQAMIPELCGALDADVSFLRDEQGAMEVELNAGAAGVILPPLQAGLLRVSLLASGEDFDALKVNATVVATRGQIEKDRFESLEVSVNGGPRTYEAHIKLDDRARVDGALSYHRKRLEVRDLVARYNGAELRADLDLVRHGTSRVKAKLDVPSLERVTKPWLETPLRGALHLGVVGAINRKEIALELSATDGRGPLLQTKIRAELGKRRLAVTQDGFADLLGNAWEAEVALQARRIDELPMIESLDLPPAVLPAVVAMDLKLGHVPKQEPEGVAHVSAYWPGPTREELKAAPARCGQRGKPRFDLEVKMKNGDLGALARAMLDGKAVASITTKATAPLNEWLQPKSPGPVSVDARFSRVPLEDVPIVCEHVAGEISGKANLNRALTQAVSIGVDLKGRGIRWGTAPTFSAHVEGRADKDAVALTTKMSTAGGHANISARVPIDVGGRAPTVDLRKPTEANVELRNMNVQALLAPVTAVSARGGKLNGEIKMNAPLVDPSFHGRLRLEKVSLVMRDLGQPIERVDSVIVFEGKTVRLLETKLHDGEGVARVSGTLKWSNLLTWNAKVDASVDDLPIRRQGVILARLDGRLSASANFTPKSHKARLKLSRAIIEMTTADLGGIQSLEVNPEILLVDEPPSQVKKELDAPPTPPTEIVFDASEPFWVRRDDFSALVSTKLNIVLNETRPTVAGEVKIQRGVVQLVGNMFDIKGGRIELLGGHGVEPVLQLRAERRAPGGDRVAIEANGPLRQPTLKFFVNDQPVTAGEAIAAASGSRAGSGGESSVQDQLGGMASGILAGVLTLGARRELGELVPVLGVETGANSTSLRAGIGARRLIPKFMRGVVTDAYIEGILTSSEEPQDGQETEGRSQTQASVLLELRFPYDLVGEAQYEPGQRWSLDLSWEP